MVAGSSLRAALLMAPAALLVIAPPSGAQTAVEFYTTGRAQMDSANPEAAIKSFEKAVSLDETNADYHFWLGRAVGFSIPNASVLRRPFLARRIKAEFERSVQLDPANIDSHEGLVMFYVRAPGIMGGSVAKARDQVAILATLSALRAHYSRAVIAVYGEKDRARADSEYQAAVAENPDSLSPAITYADFLATNGRGGDAFAALDKYLAGHPGNVVATFWIGRVAAVTGLQLDRGEKALRGILDTPNLGLREGEPLVFAVHYRLGEIAVKTGAKDVARAEYEKALGLNPKYEPARKALKAL